MANNKRKFKLTRTYFLIMAAVLAYLIIAVTVYTGWLDETGWWDHLITKFERRPPNPHVITFWIGTDELKSRELANWATDRTHFARMVRTLRDWGAKVIVFDFYFREEKSGDREFIDEIKKHGKVILALPWDESHQNSLEVPPPGFQNCGAHFGHAATTMKDVYRFLPLFVTNPIYDRRKSLNDNINALSMALLAVKLYNDWDKDEVTRGGSGLNPIISLAALKIPAVPVPSDPEGIPYHTIISYSGEPGHFREKEYDQSFSILELFQKEPDEKVKAKVKGSIVVIYNNSDPHDAYPTPYTKLASEKNPDLIPLMPGGEIHANEISSLLDKRFIYYNPFVNYSIPLLFLIMGVIIFSRPITWRTRIIFFTILCIAAWGMSLLVFQKLHILIGWSFSFFALLLLFISLIYYERRQFITYFGQFVSHKLKEEILKDEQRAEVGTREVEATILFADIRGFSTLSEQLTPGELTNVMTEYHGEMNKIFEKNRGVILDYLGDAEMVGFGTLGDEKEHALLAIKSGLEMQENLKKLCEKWDLGKRVQLEIGVGICTGMVAEGIVGSESKKQLVSMGDTTNTAARIQALSKQLDSNVTISESTYVKVKDDIVSDALKEMELKGKKNKVMLYRVKDLRVDSLIRLEKNVCRE